MPKPGKLYQNHGRPDRRIETIVDLLGVVPCDRRAVAEQPAQETGARVGDLVQDEPRFGELGENRQQPGAGRWFQHEVGRGERGRFGCHETERNRRRELLEALGFLGPSRVRR